MSWPLRSPSSCIIGKYPLRPLSMNVCTLNMMYGGHLHPVSQSRIQPLSINSTQDSCINATPCAPLDRYVEHSGVHGRWIHTSVVPHILCRTYLVALKRTTLQPARSQSRSRVAGRPGFGCQREQFRCKPSSLPFSSHSDGRDQIRIDLGHHVDTLEEQIWLRLTLIRSAFTSVKSIAICSVVSARARTLSRCLLSSIRLLAIS